MLAISIFFFIVAFSEVQCGGGMGGRRLLPNKVFCAENWGAKKIMVRDGRGDDDGQRDAEHKTEHLP